MSHKNHNRKQPPWLALIGLLIAPAIFLLLVNWNTALNSNIIELLPSSADSPEAEAARSMLNERLSYPVILKAKAPGANSEELLLALKNAAQQKAFKSPFIIGDESYKNVLLPVLKEHKETLFASHWLENKRRAFNQIDRPDEAFIPWLAVESAKQLNQFLERPESMAYTEDIPSDPLLLLPSALEALPPAPSVPNDALIAWIPVTVDPLTSEGQKAIYEALSSLESEMKSQFPQYEQTASGVYELAAASERSTKQEVTWLNVEMATVILLLLLILAGRPGFLLLTVAPVLVAGLWCVTAGILVFGHIHVISLAVSSVVLGLAVDYAVHLAAKRGHSDLRSAWPKVRLPLATSCISTCFGFLFLLLSPMAALKQVGIMAPAGLVGALLTVRWILPWLEPIAGAYRLRHFLEEPGPALPRKASLIAASGVWLAAMFILFFKPSFSDNIKDFQAPIEETISHYRALADSIGSRDVNERWYCFASSPTSLLQRLSQIQSETNVEDIRLPNQQSFEQSDFVKQSNEFAVEFRDALEKQGFATESFSPFFESLQEVDLWYAPHTIRSAFEDLAAKLRGPLQALLMTDGDVWVAVFDAPSNSNIPTSLQSFTRELAQQKSLNQALEHARLGITQSAIWGFFGMTICVVILFRRYALWTLLLPLWAVTLGIATTILLGQPLGILAVIGAILGYCLALDYGAFAATATQPPASIRISAATTGCGFFILSLCSMPAVAQLGQVVTATVLFAWLGAELLCLPNSSSPKQDTPA